MQVRSVMGLLAAAIAVLLLVSQPVQAQQADAIDLRQAVMHGVNVAGFPVTGAIERVQVRRTGPYRTDGIAIYSAAVDAWPDVWAMGLGDGGGAMRFTTWVCLPLARLECGGFVQHWAGDSGRGTGGAWLQVENGKTNWQRNWAYDANRWGAMAGYVPKPGDTVYVFAVAGNTRTGQDPEYAIVNGRPFQARTPVVAFQYPANDEGDFSFNVSAPPVVVPPPPAPPAGTPPVAPGPDLTGVQRQLDELRDYVAAVVGDLRQGIAALSQTVDGQREVIDLVSVRLTVLESKPIVARCTGHINLMVARIPVSDCRLVP